MVATAIAAVWLLEISVLGQVVPSRESKGEQEWQAQVLKVWQQQDSLAAFTHLEQSGPAQTVSQRFGKLVQHLYLEHKDLPRMILAARAGLHFNLQQAEALDALDEPAAAQFRGQAKAIAYNLGANCWPGWNEPGIVITAAERAIGLDAARINLRLGQELRRPAEPLGHAHWLLGAQLLAAKDFDPAAKQFKESASKFAEAKKPTEERMANSYQRLTRRLQNPKEAAAQTAFQESLTQLEMLNNDDARFFATQIRTAEEVFLKQPD